MSVCLVLHPRLVWPVIPVQMGVPRADQGEGTAAERLVEIAGRVCYDSFGKGRSAGDFHRHLVDVGHTSVHQHVVFTTPPTDLAIEAGLPGVTITMGRVTANLRTAIEIEKYTNDSQVIDKYQRVRKQLMPQVFGAGSATILKPAYPEERYVSLYMSGSRGFSHEQVRHHHQCAVSQRSTRYCDESASVYSYHPLLAKIDDTLGAKIEAHESRGKRLYDAIVKDLTTKGATRKQARGAARGVLGNALDTQMIFTASIPQWKRMLKQRMSNAADAEIRMIYNQVIAILVDEELMKPPAMQPAEDGLGLVLAELQVYDVHTSKGSVMVLAADADRAVSVAGVKPKDVLRVELRP